MRATLERLYDGHKLSETEAYHTLREIAEEKYNTAQMASFMTVFNMRPITVSEVMGFRACLLDLCVAVDLGTNNTIDLCGTGGDGKHTFNISTLASFVVAGAGYKVAKHGNYGVSSVSGSSNVLELLGYKFTNDNATLKAQLDVANICFMHAPLFHPALKPVGPIRRELGVKTFFNIMGPLVNPAKPNYQINGVFNLQTAALYENVLTKAEKQFTIIHGLDGFDEISLTSEAKLISNASSKIIGPNFFKMGKLELDELSGGQSKEEAAQIFTRILNGNGTVAQNNVVLANAALAIKTIESKKDIIDCLEVAKKSLEGGLASKALDSLLKQQNS